MFISRCLGACPRQLPKVCPTQFHVHDALNVCIYIYYIHSLQMHADWRRLNKFLILLLILLLDLRTDLNHPFNGWIHIRYVFLYIYIVCEFFLIYIYICICSLCMYRCFWIFLVYLYIYGSILLHIYIFTLYTNCRGKAGCRSDFRGPSLRNVVHEMTYI